MLKNKITYRTAFGKSERTSLEVALNRFRRIITEWNVA
jgi:hypothetical protein